MKLNILNRPKHSDIPFKKSRLFKIINNLDKGAFGLDYLSIYIR